MEPFGFSRSTEVEVIFQTIEFCDSPALIQGENTIGVPTGVQSSSALLGFFSAGNPVHPLKA